ncbi:MAG: hypothetical protein IPK68_09990 [Bdellovibrionales bacterium]|nr:hypothetical protein [Bdellovibrionales bacterium]
MLLDFGRMFLSKVLVDLCGHELAAKALEEAHNKFLALDAYALENVSMMSVSTLEQCFADFVAGRSLAYIAKERGLCKRTLERYSSNQHWVIRRQRAWELAKENIVREVALRAKLNDNLVCDQILNLLRENVAQQRAYLSGEIPKRAVRGGLKQMIGLAKALYHANFAERLSLINGEAVIIGYDGDKISL